MGRENETHQCREYKLEKQPAVSPSGVTCFDTNPPSSPNSSQLATPSSALWLRHSVSVSKTSLLILGLGGRRGWSWDGSSRGNLEFGFGGRRKGGQSSEIFSGKLKGLSPSSFLFPLQDHLLKPQVTSP